MHTASFRKFAKSPAIEQFKGSNNLCSWFYLCFPPPRLLDLRMHFDTETIFPFDYSADNSLIR